MEAQIYAPASSFAEPVPVPIEDLRSEFVSLEELLSAPAAWAIVVKHEPLFNLLAQALKPIFSNMTVSSFVHYGLITRQTVDAIWTCNGFVPVTDLIMPPLLRTPAG